MDTSSDARWADHPNYLVAGPTLTIAKMQELIRALNAEMGLNIKTTQGLKAEIWERIAVHVRHWKTTNDLPRFIKYKEIYNRLASAHRAYQFQPSSSYPNQHSHSSSTGYGGSTSTVGSSFSTSYVPAPAPYATHHQASSSSSSSSYVARPKPVPKWKESPLFRVIAPVSEMTVVSESHSSTDRRTAYMHFQLSSEHRRLVEASIARPSTSTSDAPTHAIRLFCTSAAHWTPTGPTSAAIGGLPVEFPQTSEVRVNSVLISANLKGMKKKPGSCPPAALMRGKQGETGLVRLGERNTIELVHVNSSTQPNFKVQRYYMQACLVEQTRPDTLVKVVQRQPRRSNEQVVDAMKQDNEDAEIQLGAQTVKLMCPLSYVRMTTPVRSVLCDHVQCFEADSWFQINEQTPTWSCPVCERPLGVTQLFVDEYTETIIRSCPDTIDEVLVEPNGDWYTSDGKHGSPAWIAAHPPKAVTIVPARTATPVDAKGKAKQVLSLDDSEDEDEDGYRMSGGGEERGSALIPSSSSRSQSTSAGPPSAVRPPQETIDLTLSSDEDDDPPPPPAVWVSAAAGSSASSSKRGLEAEDTDRTQAGGAGDKRPRLDQDAWSGVGQYSATPPETTAFLNSLLPLHSSPHTAMSSASPVPYSTATTNGYGSSSSSNGRPPSSTNSHINSALIDSLRAQAQVSSAAYRQQSSAAGSSAGTSPAANNSSHAPLTTTNGTGRHDSAY